MKPRVAESASFMIPAIRLVSRDASCASIILILMRLILNEKNPQVNAPKMVKAL